MSRPPASARRGPPVSTEQDTVRRITTGLIVLPDTLPTMRPSSSLISMPSCNSLYLINVTFRTPALATATNGVNCFSRRRLATCAIWQRYRVTRRAPPRQPMRSRPPTWLRPTDMPQDAPTAAAYAFMICSFDIGLDAFRFA